MPTLYFSGRPLMQVEKALDKDVELYRSLTFAESTKRTYTYHLRLYMEFCRTMGYSPTPASTPNLCRYIAFLSRRMSYTSITQYINIIRILHLEAGYVNPLQNNFMVQSVLRGVRRHLGNEVCRKAPITPKLLLRILSTLNLESIEDSAVWAACLVGFCCMLRKSNLMASTNTTFNPKHNLTRQDIEVEVSQVVVNIRWSKTIQFKERVHRIPLTRTNSALCPVLAITKHFSLTSGAPRPGAAFLTTGSPDYKPLTACVFLRRVKWALAAAGHDASEISGHSFRRGGASFAHQAGVPLHTIKQIGDWQSDCYVKYVYDDVTSIRTSCHAMYKSLSKFM